QLRQWLTVSQGATVPSRHCETMPMVSLQTLLSPLRHFSAVERALSHKAALRSMQSFASCTGWEQALSASMYAQATTSLQADRERSVHEATVAVTVSTAP